MIRLVGADSYGQRMGSFDGQLITDATMEIPEECDNLYIEIEDKLGKQAWSNTLFV